MKTIVNSSVKDTSFRRNFTGVVFDFEGPIIDRLLNAALTVSSLAIRFCLCVIRRSLGVTSIGSG